MHISFLLHYGYGVGGTIRTTFTLARALAEHHDVEIVSVFRHRDEPAFDPGPKVRLDHLVDLREESPEYDGAEPEHYCPSRLFPRADGCSSAYSALTDWRIAGWLRESEADVVVGTRPGLNAQLTALAAGGRGPLLVGQQHAPLAAQTRGARMMLRDVCPQLDAVVTVTEADARDFRRRMALRGVRVESVPNPVPAPEVPPADGTGRWIVAAGRLVPAKRYDLLLRAFARVAPERPDWGLRIYGRGPERARLRALVEELGLRGRAQLKGVVTPLEPEWVQGSVGVSTSRVEAFGMTIVEAMRCGLPVVATRCPHGPAEIIRHGEDGLLVPVDDADAVAAGLLRLTGDDALRQRMGRAALAHAERFDPAGIAERYSVLFAELAAGGRSARRRASLRGTLHRSRGAAFRHAYDLWDTARRARRERSRGAAARQAQSPRAAAPGRPRVRTGQQAQRQKGWPAGSR
ncbi:glycosyltransferase family 4 protein [Streptomyces sp. JJ36]|uniref:glycosyltransferase family 4 protein n=1 Tax=Streptomyces sp. JJ36 TaxID=2736645 RepID=UPI001F4658B3|nr:glycosyltransferase family 4 protein [Streptomyces sp. JJ36]MCF6524025.1 glycosyltransferase family 4 protein [Streptomyces sp. JJ36]